MISLYAYEQFIGDYILIDIGTIELVKLKFGYEFVEHGFYARYRTFDYSIKQSMTIVHPRARMFNAKSICLFWTINDL